MDDKEIAKQQKQRVKPLSRLQRLIERTIAQDTPLGGPDDAARDLYPALWEWLSVTDVGKDRIMQPASVTMVLVPEGVNVSVNHRGLNKGFSVVCPSLADVFPALEAYLTGPSPIIRDFGRGSPKIRQRPKIG